MLFSSAANSFFCETRLTVDAVIVGGVIIVVMETRGHEKFSCGKSTPCTMRCAAWIYVFLRENLVSFVGFRNFQFWFPKKG